MNDAEEGVYLVTHAETDSAVLKDVEDGQVHTLADNPGIKRGDVVEATLAPEPPLEVAWRVVEVDERQSLSVERSEEPPTEQERALAADGSAGDLVQEERAGIGELHVLSVDPDGTEAAVRDVLADEATLARAARMEGVERVEVRAEPGMISVRYLP